MHRRKKLIFWRIERRLKQKDLAKELGITPSHYCNIERGYTDPSYELLRKFRYMYNKTDVIEMFEKENEPWQQ